MKIYLHIEFVDFKRTAVHEVEHEILSVFGRGYSTMHKGTSTLYQGKVKNTPYPAVHHEIDLMKYSDSKWIPSDYYERSIVAKNDAIGLIWLTRIKVG